MYNTCDSCSLISNMYVDFNTLRVFINDFWRMCTLISVKADLDKYWERCPNNVYNVYTSYMKYIIMNFFIDPCKLLDSIVYPINCFDCLINRVIHDWFVHMCTYFARYLCMYD